MCHQKNTTNEIPVTELMNDEKDIVEASRSYSFVSALPCVLKGHFVHGIDL